MSTETLTIHSWVKLLQNASKECGLSERGAAQEPTVELFLIRVKDGLFLELFRTIQKKCESHVQFSKLLF